MVHVTECVVRRPWRWYQVSALVVTAIAGLAVLVFGLIADNIALLILGAIWLLLSFLGFRSLAKVLWSVTVHGPELTLRGPRITAVIPVSDVRAARFTSFAVVGRSVLTLETNSLGTLRFGPMPSNTSALVAELQAANPELHL